MEPTQSAATESRKRKRGLDVNDLKKLFDTEPDDYENAWNELKHRVIGLNEHARQTAPLLAPSTISLPDARQIFNLRQVKDVLWAGIDEIPVPQYLSDSIDRILAVTSETHHTNEAFSRTIIDQILISALYEENNTQTTQHHRASSPPEDPAVLELQHETQLQRQKSHLATNLIIIEANQVNSTGTCLGQLTAYMGLVYANGKDEQQPNSVIYGVASDDLSFRFCRIDNDGNWSQSQLMESGMGHQGRIYSIFRSLIRIAVALSSPSTTSTIQNHPQQREKMILASFGGPERTIRRFGDNLRALRILEEDDETEIVSLRETRLAR
ncbi:MAG: hypothetical protein Q9216_004323 [Gyalolechia sp. 2 TL-2023]